MKKIILEVKKINKTFLIIFCMSLVLISYNVAFAVPFTNGDFSNGFTGWTAEVDNSTTSKTVNPVIDTNFDIVGTTQEAQISDNDTYWMDGLYQDFDAPSLISSGYKLNINFWIKWVPTNNTLDGLSVTLDPQSGLFAGQDLLAGVSTSDLLSGTTVTQDVTSWAGTPVELSFFLWDWDSPDYLYIDNITFTQIPPSNVPEPTTLMLLSSGLLALFYKRKRRLIS